MFSNKKINFQRYLHSVHTRRSSDLNHTASSNQTGAHSHDMNTMWRISGDHGSDITDGNGPKFRRYYEEQNTKEADRKSTRLNSSHVAISYDVFCLINIDLHRLEPNK